MPYLLIQRQAAQGPLESTFAVAYEAYRDRPFLAETALSVDLESEPDAADLTVRLANERGTIQCRFEERGPNGIAVKVKTTIGDLTDEFVLDQPPTAIGSPPAPNAGEGD